MKYVPPYLDSTPNPTILVKDKVPSQRGAFSISPKEYDPALHEKCVPEKRGLRARLVTTPDPEAQIELSKLSLAELRKLPEFSRVAEADSSSKQSLVEAILKVRADTASDATEGDELA
jgi:hypothetical protein